MSGQTNPSSIYTSLSRLDLKSHSSRSLRGGASVLSLISPFRRTSVNLKQTKDEKMEVEIKRFLGSSQESLGGGDLTSVFFVLFRGLLCSALFSPLHYSVSALNVSELLDITPQCIETKAMIPGSLYPYRSSTFSSPRIMSVDRPDQPGRH